MAPGLADADTAELVARIEAIIGSVSEIDGVLDHERQLIEGEAAIADLNCSIAAAESGVTRLTKRQARLPVELAEKRRLRGVAHDAAERVDALTTARARIGEQHEAARLRDQLDGRLREHEVAQNELIDGARRSYERWLGLISAQTSTQAARLAAELEPGAPCPVCGAHEHPKLATSGADLVSDDAVERARRHQERAGKAVNDANVVRSELAEQLAAARATSGGGVVDELAAARTAARTRLA